MKLLLIAALVACAFAEPDADAYYGSVYGLGTYGYGSGLYGYRGYSAYPYTYGYGYPSTYSYGYSRLHKRDADAEPKADAYYGSVYGLGSYGYNTGLYGYRGYSAYPYTYGYGYPATYSYGSYRLHKRDADAEPKADAYYGSVYGLGSYGYNTGLYGYRGYSAYPYTYGYGYPATYSYGSYRLHKRDADAEPKADAYYAGVYGYGYPSYGYTGYTTGYTGYSTAGYGYPYSYGRYLY